MSRSGLPDDISALIAASANVPPIRNSYSEPRGKRNERRAELEKDASIKKILQGCPRSIDPNIFIQSYYFTRKGETKVNDEGNIFVTITQQLDVQEAIEEPLLIKAYFGNWGEIIKKIKMHIELDADAVAGAGNAENDENDEDIDNRQLSNAFCALDDDSELDFKTDSEYGVPRCKLYSTTEGQITDVDLDIPPSYCMTIIKASDMEVCKKKSKGAAGGRRRITTRKRK